MAAQQCICMQYIRVKWVKWVIRARVVYSAELNTRAVEAQVLLGLQLQPLMACCSWQWGDMQVTNHNKFVAYNWIVGQPGDCLCQAPYYCMHHVTRCRILQSGFMYVACSTDQQLGTCCCTSASAVPTCVESHCPAVRRAQQRLRLHILCS